MNRRVLILIVLFIVSIITYLLWKNERENRLISEGNEIIAKIESYKYKNNKLPSSLADIGIIVKDDSSLKYYYEQRDINNYTLSFGMELGESKLYYSDTKKWEDFYR